jgi:hypothetical protein
VHRQTAQRSSPGPQIGVGALPAPPARSPVQILQAQQDLLGIHAHHPFLEGPKLGQQGGNGAARNIL